VPVTRLRSEATLSVGLKVEDLQRREEHWAIVDMVGKAGHVRTVPIPDWVIEELQNC
jgi:hypothetical protein